MGRSHIDFRSLAARACALVLAVAVFMTGIGIRHLEAAGLPLIRDTEIEQLLRDYATPVFRAAGLRPDGVNVYIINAPTINAFVSGGQRVFIHTGLITECETPNEVIGVLAHETGHIAGGHLTRMQRQLDKASTAAIVGMLLGVATMVGAGLSGQGELARGGQGLMLGGQSLAERNLLSYARAQESSADQAAVKYLTATKQSAKGMIDLFEKLSNQSLASSVAIDPYVLSHPMPLDRVRNLEINARKSPYFDTPDDPALLARHRMVQAKLTGFLGSPQRVYQKYPTSDTSPPARYARSIVAFRTGDTRAAMVEIDALLQAQPKNPYFWELKGQALLEGGSPKQAIAPLRKAVELMPRADLTRVMLAQAMLSTEDPGLVDSAQQLLLRAKRTEADSPDLHAQLALSYARKNNIPMADLETAEVALLTGDYDLAKQKAKRSMAAFKRGTPEWIRANDILNVKTEDS
ncbi:putative Zn-dependent protease [Rhodoligotrophos appendicifer]|uniref:M48 family metalloprotease n=1 Tax=Rhodoligotrophos appendicifer TaxID=987056 RepID=UPI001186CCF1|nr:M48 family metalloprotease [Rhodoligotrophos appendicifer]